MNLNLKGKKGSEIRRPEDIKRVSCREHFLKFLDLAKEGKVSIKGRTMFIHELVAELINKTTLTNEELSIIEGQWNSHIQYFEKSVPIINKEYLDAEKELENDNLDCDTHNNFVIINVCN